MVKLVKYFFDRVLNQTKHRYSILEINSLIFSHINSVNQFLESTAELSLIPCTDTEILFCQMGLLLLFSKDTS